MATVSVDHRKAKDALNKAWRMIDDKSILSPATIESEIESVLVATDITFKYILVTGLLAKCVEPSVHPRALQRLAH